MAILTVLMSLLGLLVPWFSGINAYRAVAAHGRDGE
jgi:hypothetical protein